MNILVKFPSRARPAAFLARLREWYGMAADKQRLSFLVSYDLDDSTMTEEVIGKAKDVCKKMVIIGGNSKSKIEACNDSLNEYEKPWDVVLLISDDMFCRQVGWDDIIRKQMTETYPDTDGSLWFFDGAQRDINTLSCLGRAYYDRFNFIYHPDYRSFFCDNEQTEVGLKLNRIKRIATPIASHEHPAWLGGMPKDGLYQQNSKFWASDEATYNRRKANAFQN